MYLTNDACIIDKQTGRDLLYIKKDTKISIRSKRQDKSYQDVITKKKNDFLFNEFQKMELGGFVFMIYNNIELLTKQLEIPLQDIPKLMYLSSYLNYENVLMVNQRNKMTKSNMKELLMLSRNQFSKFFNLIIEKEILIEEKNDKQKYYKLNENIFKKGEITTDSMKTKMYINSVRFLYENTNTRMHSNLAIVFQLIPYVHKELNIICKNPYTDNRELINPFNINDICNALNINTDGVNAKNITRVKKQLYSLILEDGTRVIRSYRVDTNKTDKWVLNPKVVSNFIDYDSYNNFNNTFDLLFNNSIADC